MLLFSIIIPTRNRADLLRQCIQSVIDQCFKNFELIIVDDGSTDHTKEAIAAFKDDRVKYYYQSHKERSTARNYGLKKASGNYICFIDDDDYVLSDHLLVFNNAIVEASYNKEILRVGYRPSSGNKSTPIYSKAVHKNPVRFALYNMCGVWSLCIPSEYVKNITFPEEFPHWQDTYFILRLFAKYELKQLQESTYVYRIHQNMGSLLVKNEQQLSQRADINVAAMIDFKARYYDQIKDKVDKKVFDFIAAEKYAMYAVLAKQGGYKNLSKELMLRSRGYQVSIRMWKYYLWYFIPYSS